MPERGEDLLRHRLDKLSRLRQQGIDPYPRRYQRSHVIQEARALFEEAERHGSGEARTVEVKLAGRLIAMRSMGKASFGDLRDSSGRVQLHLRRDILGDQYQLLKELDLGDFVGVEGPLFRTHAGEATVEVHKLAVLCKAILPLPEKWHGLQDVEKRYRQRYLDLVVNPEVRQVFHLRSKILGAVRRFMDARGFVEVETPILVPVAAGAMARPFATHHNALDRELYLRIATELYLKRLVVGGIEKVYEIGKVFRNEGIDAGHNPEFTLLESYEAYADYKDVMEMVETMVSTISREVLGTAVVHFKGQEIDLTPPWRRLSLRDAIRQYAGVEIEEYTDAASLGYHMAGMGLEVSRRESRGRLIDKLVGTCVEPHLAQPTFLIDYPVEMSPLAKAKEDDPRYVERFEGFAVGMEVANSFTELNDPLVQRQRFEEQERLRQQYGDEEYDRMDEDFLLALEHGMPPTGGLGMGVDRLVMLLTGQETIRDVVLFPQLRTLR